MEKKQLGNSDLMVSPIAFGGNVFGWTIDENQSHEIIDAFVGNGFNFIDTANNYSYWVKGNDGGESERIIGTWLKKRRIRDKVIIGTKVGGRGKNFAKPNASKKHIKEEVDNSLMRLQTDYIDLYQLHYDDEVTPVEETLSAFQDLIQDGKIRAIGASNISAERLLDSLEASEKYSLPRYETLQPLYNLYDREKFETEYQSIAAVQNLSVINYYSLASGFLTGKYRSDADFGQSQRGKDVKQYMNERGFRILDCLDEVASEQNTTPAVISLAWLLNQPTIAAPIVSATSLRQLESIIQAPKIQLTDEQEKRLDEASDFRN
ncbi:aldo/keto reductase [Moheibacter stercoris]|uniref:Aryl-alcohol dehydrogenase-like predicted oxidoreductase n=1 Tax=Moheibacter stercoris TaxID=1628251 RepID=A0ABV2LVL9_9FLAO